MPKSAAPKSETRRFRIDPHAIMTLIGAQAGTLQKALLEGVANSIDAGATRVEIKADAHRVSLADNGSGLDKKGIEKHFEVFGFDHTNLGRQIGRFGVGRGQLFCFGKNTWRTGVHEMHVDIKANGLDYELTSRSKSHKGMSIDIDLYQKLTPFTLNQLEEDLRRLVRFSIVPVLFNGKQLSEDPAQRKKWTEETDEAWFNLRKDGQLTIYSQGLLVQEYSSYRYSCGGEVITKPGHALRQNLARNEILENECPVWKKVSARIHKAGQVFRGVAARTGTMNEGMRKSMALQALDPATAVADNADMLLHESLFTLNNGRHVKLEALLRRQVVAVAASRDLKADKLMQGGVAQVLDPVTLERFGVETPEELAGRLRKALDARIARGGMWSWRAKHLKESLDECVFHDSIKELSDLVDDSFEEVAVRKLPADQRAALGSISRLAWRATRVMNRALGLEDSDPLCRSPRTLLAMKCATMDACTNGSNTVWINVKRLQDACKNGLPGFQRLMALFVHEHLHTESSRASHVHDHDFFEAFHNIVLDSTIADLGMIAYAGFLRRGPKPPKKLLAQVDEIFDAAGEVLGDETLCVEAPAEPVVSEAAPEAAPPRRRRRAP